MAATIPPVSTGLRIILYVLVTLASCAVLGGIGLYVWLRQHEGRTRVPGRQNISTDIELALRHTVPVNPHPPNATTENKRTEALTGQVKARLRRPSPRDKKRRLKPVRRPAGLDRAGNEAPGPLNEGGAQDMVYDF